MEATATVEVPFSLGIPENQHKEEQKINNEYFKQEDQCRSLIHSRQYEQAEATCKSAVDLAERLPPERALERTEAYGNTGNALLGQQKFAEALGYFRREATLDEKVLKPIDAELGYGYHHLALALYATGDLKQALDYYDRSIKTLELALGQKSMQEFQGQYLKSLKKILLEYAQVLRQNGDIVAAGRSRAAGKFHSIAALAQLYLILGLVRSPTAGPQDGCRESKRSADPRGVRSTSFHARRCSPARFTIASACYHA